MSKEDVLELAKKYNCDVEFGMFYHKYYKPKQGGSKATKYTQVPIEELMMNNEGRSIYIYTFRDDNVLWGDKQLMSHKLEEHYDPPYVWLRAVVYDKPTIAKEEKKVPKKKLSPLQKACIDKWVLDNEEKCLILNPHNNTVSYKPFLTIAEDEYNGQEYGFAMKYLDELGIPREDEEGQAYSIIGRIKYLKNEQNRY